MAYHSTGGKGGGEVRISATTSFNLDGSLLANGGAGWGWNAGGGSGGSIFVDCFKFTGTTNSVMSAKGNDFSGDMAGSSGGGRIAVWYKILPADRVRLLSGSMESVQVSETYDGFLGEADVTPGTKLRAGFVAASPGTVVFLTKDIPTLMLIR